MLTKQRNCNTAAEQPSEAPQCAPPLVQDNLSVTLPLSLSVCPSRQKTEADTEETRSDNCPFGIMGLLGYAYVSLRQHNAQPKKT